MSMQITRLEHEQVRDAINYLLDRTIYCRFLGLTVEDITSENQKVKTPGTIVLKVFSESNESAIINIYLRVDGSVNFLAQGKNKILGSEFIKQLINTSIMFKEEE